MPLPEPNEDEEENEFISRCLSDSDVQEKFGEGTDQAQAVCFDQWDESKKEKTMIFQFIDGEVEVEELLNFEQIGVPSIDEMDPDVRPFLRELKQLAEQTAFRGGIFAEGEVGMFDPLSRDEMRDAVMEALRRDRDFPNPDMIDALELGRMDSAGTDMAYPVEVKVDGFTVARFDAFAFGHETGPNPEDIEASSVQLMGLEFVIQG